MASPEVCKALPTMTWLISSGATPLRESASFAAITPRSMAVMSLNEPLYSAIGVRAPSRMTMSFIGSPARSKPPHPPSAPSPPRAGEKDSRWEGRALLLKHSWQFHAEVLHQEGHLIGGFLD